LERQRKRSKVYATTRDLCRGLDQVVREIDQVSTRLYQMSGKFGQELRENEWLMGIKQRTNMPAAA
jgi:cell division protein ZapD